MNRTALIWFAAGAATSGAAALTSDLFGPEREAAWRLIVWETGVDQMSSLPGKWRGAEIARSCKAQGFFAVPSPGPHVPDRTELSLKQPNADAIECIMHAAQLAKLEVQLSQRKF